MRYELKHGLVHMMCLMFYTFCRSILRLTPEQKIIRDQEQLLLKQQQYDDNVGFRRIWELIYQSQKPVVGHNCKSHIIAGCCYVGTHMCRVCIACMVSSCHMSSVCLCAVVTSHQHQQFPVYMYMNVMISSHAYFRSL